MPFYNYKIFNQELSYTYLYADRALGNLRHAILEQNFNVRFNGIQNLILFKEEMKKSYYFFEKKKVDHVDLIRYDRNFDNRNELSIL